VDTFAVVLVIAIASRIVLDVVSLAKPSPRFDIVYAILFAVIGVVGVIDNPRSYFGYLCFAVSAIWSVIFVHRHKLLRESDDPVKSKSDST
jgi:hypothetical protein